MAGPLLRQSRRILEAENLGDRNDRQNGDNKRRRKDYAHHTRVPSCSALQVFLEILEGHGLTPFLFFTLQPKFFLVKSILINCKFPVPFAMSFFASICYTLKQELFINSR